MQNLPVVVLVNCLTWKNTFWGPVPCQSKEINDVCCVLYLTCLAFFWCREADMSAVCFVDNSKHFLNVNIVQVQTMFWHFSIYDVDLLRQIKNQLSLLEFSVQVSPALTLHVCATLHCFTGSYSSCFCSSALFYHLLFFMFVQHCIILPALHVCATLHCFTSSYSSCMCNIA